MNKKRWWWLIMKNNHQFFRYVTGNSKLHLMNSKMKIIWFILLIINFLIIKDTFSLIICLLFLMFIILQSKINIKIYMQNLIRIYPIYIIVFVGSFLINHNILNGFFDVLKTILIIVLFLVLTFTTSLSEIAWGIECVLRPMEKIGISVSNFSLRIAFSIKFISTLFEKFYEVRKSMAHRGLAYGKNKLKSFNRMVIPSINLSYKLSRQTIMAMKLRFYGHSKKRTNYHENKVTKFDKTLVFIDIVLLYVVIWLGWS